MGILIQCKRFFLLFKKIKINKLKLTTKFWQNKKFGEEITLTEVDAYVQHYVTKEDDDDDDERSTGDEEEGEEETSEME